MHSPNGISQTADLLIFTTRKKPVPFYFSTQIEDASVRFTKNQALTPKDT